MIDRQELRDRFTEIVAIRLDVDEQREQGVYPPRTDLDRWRRRYFAPKPPYPFVVLNTFENKVDEFVSHLMLTVSEVEAL